MQLTHRKLTQVYSRHPCENPWWKGFFKTG